MGFSKQEYWRGLAFPTPGDLPDAGIKPTSFASPALASGFFNTSATWEAQIADEKLLYSRGSPAWCSVMTWKGGLEEGREALERVDICIVMSGLHCCVGETNITL